MPSAMLTEEQKRQLTDLVLDHLGMVNPSPATLRGLVGAELVREAPGFANSYGCAVWVLKTALARPAPDLLIQVVESVDLAGRLPEVHAFIARLKADPSLWTVKRGDPLWLLNRRPFVDRTELRQLLGEMAAGTGPGAVVVEGPLGEGKSTVCRYVEKLAVEAPGFRPVIEEIRVETVDAVDLDLLAARLQQALQGSGTLDAHPEPERRASNLASELALTATSAPQPVWLLADGIDVAGVPGELVRFVDELQGWAQRSEDVARGLRVVLLAEEISRIRLDHLPPLEARAPLPAVTETCVRDWLAAAVPGKTEILYQLTASSVARKLAEPARSGPAQRMKWLDLLVEAAHQKLAKVGSS